MRVWTVINKETQEIRVFMTLKQATEAANCPIRTVYDHFSKGNNETNGYIFSKLEVKKNEKIAERSRRTIKNNPHILNNLKRG